ncbi:MAG: hypothetical protein ABIZ50_07520, partial [Solirubrobacterales bacterium]
MSGLIVIACLLMAAGAQAGSGAQIVSALNQQRVANGLPAGIAERPDWSANCALHNSYMALTGTFGHVEIAGNPHFTVGGDWAASRSVLATGGDWGVENPFETAPIHLANLLNPALAEMGADAGSNFICATTIPGTTRTPPAGVVGYSYPGDGVDGVAPSERASESPYVPGDFVGL